METFVGVMYFVCCRGSRRTASRHGLGSVLPAAAGPGAGAGGGGQLRARRDLTETARLAPEAVGPVDPRDGRGGLLRV